MDGEETSPAELRDIIASYIPVADVMRCRADPALMRMFMRVWRVEHKYAFANTLRVIEGMGWHCEDNTLRRETATGSAVYEPGAAERELEAGECKFEVIHFNREYEGPSTRMIFNRHLLCRFRTDGEVRTTAYMALRVDRPGGGSAALFASETLSVSGDFVHSALVSDLVRVPSANAGYAAFIPKSCYNPIAAPDYPHIITRAMFIGHGPDNSETLYFTRIALTNSLFVYQT
jgi:hypothetical protein